MIRIKSGFSGEYSLVLPKMVTDMMESDSIASSLYITDIGYYPKAKSHYRKRDKPIDQYVLIYCVDGKGSYELFGKKHEVIANSYFILPAGQPHKYQADSITPWTIYWIHFKGALAEHYAKGATMPIAVDPELHSRINNRNKLFEELYETLNSDFSLESIKYATSLFHHYLGSLRYIKPYRIADPNSSNSIVAVATHFMNENIERHITLKDVANYVGYSPSRLSSVFKTTTGHSPLNYINLLKIKHACELLDTSTMKINQICHKVGISDQYYFSRLFSKIMGKSPRSYRTTPKA